MAAATHFEERRKMTPTGPWTRLNEWFGRYRLIWYVLIAVLLALGFDFKTPAAQFRAGRVADSLKGVRIDSVVRALGTRDLINIGIARYLCYKDREAAALFMPCAYLGNGAVLPPP